MHQPAPERSRHEIAIARIASAIRECPDTSGGVQLRRFLWSLYNQHHVICCFDLVSRLSSNFAEPVSEILRAAIAGDLTENDIKRGLLAAGEMDRWDETIPGESAVTLLDEASHRLIRVLTKTPPCYEHVEVTRILRSLETLKDDLIRKA
jgi:hypothetical protein